MNIEHLAGKVVQGIFIMGEYAIINFTDEVLVLEAHYDRYGDIRYIDEEKLSDVSDHHLVECGFMTKQQAEERRIQEAQKWDDQQKESRRRQFEQLKAEFET